MSLHLETKEAVESLEKLSLNANNEIPELRSLIWLLDSVLFKKTTHIQDSLQELKRTSIENHHLTANDFDISTDGSYISLLNEEKDDFQTRIRKLAGNRETYSVKLYKKENSSLGFSVIGLQDPQTLNFGTFVQDISPFGPAAQEGGLQENDQILAINGELLTNNQTHALNLLHAANGEINLVIARTVLVTNYSPSLDALNTCELLAVEVVDLVNDGNGLGFGIMGGKSTGVVVKTVVEGGVADRDGRLKSGDHLLHVGEWSVRGMNSDKVAAVLRKAGTHVRLVVARPVLDTSQEIQTPPYSVVISNDKLEEHLQGLYHLGLAENSANDLDPDEEVQSDEIFFDVNLSKDNSGLGITIAGLIGSSANGKLCGIYVRHITPNSAAELDGRIQPNDRIVEVNGRSLEGFSNAQAVEVLKATGQTVSLKLARPRHGATHLAELQRSLAETTDTCLESFKTPNEDDSSLKSYWCQALTLQADEVIIAHVTKFKEGGGLGVSLEGTVDVEDDGKEVRPHHYIHSILPDGPVGKNGCIEEGDELLEVNGQRLLGLNYKEVVNILKSLPQNVTLVCCRKTTSLQGNINPGKVVKAKSEDNLSIEKPGVILRWRSAEPLTSIALWNENITEVKLVKAEKGLGFSVLDYQDPYNSNRLIVVVRSLVPGGVAQSDGRIVPGDRLMYVNEISLENATLEDAVNALKGAPSGEVKIGLVKPISPDVPDCSLSDIPLMENYLSSTPIINNMESEPKLDRDQDDSFHNSTGSNQKTIEIHPSIRDTTMGLSPVSIHSEAETGFSNSPSPKLRSTQNLLFTPPKTVVVRRKMNESLGISIVGGKLEFFSTSNISPPSSPQSPISGIFVKHVLHSGPAAGLLKMGDHILEVDGRDIRYASHDEAVEAIKLSKTPVTFLVQSISDPSDSNLNSSQKIEKDAEKGNTIEMISASKLFSNQQDSSSVAQYPLHPAKNETSSSSSENDLTADSYQLYSMVSVDQTKCKKSETVPTAIDTQNSEIDSIDLNGSKLKYQNLSGELLRLSFERDNPRSEFGLSLVGNKHPDKQGVFVSEIDPNSWLLKDGGLKIGDELLEASYFIINLYCLTQSDNLPDPGLSNTSEFSNSPDKAEKEAKCSSIEKDLQRVFLESYVDIKKVHLNKETQRDLEFSVKDDTVQGVKGVYIDRITQNSTVCDEIRIGDHLIALELPEGIAKLDELTSQEATEVLRNIPDGPFNLYLVPSLNSNQEIESTEQTDQKFEEVDLSTVPIAVGKKTTITIAKGKSGLGLSIVGGADTMIGEILIHEVYAEGAAAKDGRLCASDKILEVDGKSLKHTDHDEAISILRRTQDVVTMVVFRADTSLSPRKSDDESYTTFNITLIKKPNKGLGLSIVGRRGQGGVFISDIVKGGVADTNGHLYPGDRLMSVNGEDLRDSSQEDAAAVLKTLMGKVTLTIGRLKKGGKSEGSIEEVILERGSRRLGFTVVGGSDSPQGRLPIYVKTVSEDGSADKVLFPGCELLSVNDHELNNVTHAEAVTLIKHARDPIRLLVRYPQDPE
ncbi:DgyrCDS4296 [Dimorphilus gyrociliatus]|uniref:DgyrCDS4296 n=1 Tax=Dimorphilus gyrociliatus TaxID=2664684 RepID=A0A7I8VIS7_9ANNE|nr:DgyrCDS4296 [Dimorphilus gyrociliatus]